MEHLLSKIKGDKMIWLVVLALSLVSALAVYSSIGTLAYKFRSGNTEYYLFKHVALIIIGLGLMYLAHLINYRYYSKLAQILLYITGPLLILTMFLGSNINDATRWITLPVVNLTFQPSDLAKLSLIMYTARMLSKKQSEIKDFQKTFLPILLPIIGICILIIPADLSTAVLLFATNVLLMFIGRVSLVQIGALVGTGMISIAFVILLLFVIPEDKMMGRMATWKARIESFTDSGEPSYQVKHAKIAIAKGGIFKIRPGGSVQRNYLPHPYSDFIYAIIIEEYGLIGGVLIVLLYLTLLFRSIKIVAKSPGAFGALLAVGLALSLVLQAMVNMAVTVNLLPVTGLTLPMVSMGGSSMWFTSIAIGIILSVSRSIENVDESKKTNQFEVV